MTLIRSIQFSKVNKDIFPYQLPFFGHEMIFDAPVTILIGENGSGKSTFLELINEVIGLYKIKDKKILHPELISPISDAKSYVKIKYALSKPKGFFFSAEDFTSYIDDMMKEKAEAYQELKMIDQTYKHKSALSKSLARMPHMRTIGEINNLYQSDLLTSSHGEAYLDFFKSRIREKELYLLDEPETPLSIQNQLTLLSMIDEGIKRENQFIIATHSPILMAIPYATIYEVSDKGFQRIAYDQIESVILLKQFMNHPESFLKHLYRDEKNK
ncbi:MAG: hypothetical protein A2Y45_03730 [Tenericutes bacterium GWC2_34_14]|nr:MAG: ABC-type antimicrobial peptide transport system ATPase component [candidate division TM6 bacterium GW2011_GWA2_36_9]OHE29243.1 MAG: hypothetical protein A2Y45_03730 [Tenericutes bacterium GWC2_34_14]OHE34326.1 MAG: hypothetical protein A2012_09320 [Tenericutes bacterium GWE2_34_108]OHE35678.1 MAG: hypothetical protein A2Y46_06085 [Tenericutes bacterium GWF1_35_14]OHE38893.1 MAG: hypothetical protein A2Y44_00520 [Tenericutes bacterium GWF2_35_184]OHE43925.1 MAG: hypothetical protein A22